MDEILKKHKQKSEEQNQLLQDALDQKENGRADMSRVIIKTLTKDYVTFKEFAENIKSLSEEITSQKNSISSSLNTSVSSIEEKVVLLNETIQNLIEVKDARYGALFKDIQSRVSDIKKELVSSLKQSKEDIKILMPEDGIDGKDGQNGKDGRDGSPDTGLEIKAKLLNLSEEDKLKLKDFGGYDSLLTKIEKIGNKSLLPYSGITTTFFSLFGADKGRAKNINFVTGPTLNVTLAGDTATITIPTGSGGSVTSVGLSLPSIFTVTNSPVTGIGTLTGAFNTQTANTIFAGPSSGGAATPTFRALVTADLPAGTGNITGTGVNHQVALWSGTSTQNSSNQFTFDPNAGFGIIVPGSGTISASTALTLADGSGDSVQMASGINTITAATRIALSTTTVRVSSLAGSGTRMVTADASGNLATAAVPAGGTVTSVATGAGLTGGTITTTGTIAMTTNALTMSPGIAFDGNGGVIATGVSRTFIVPFSGTITGWNISAGPTGGATTCTLDVWKIAAGTANPTVSNTITASAKPALASGNVIESTTLTSWTTSVTAGDIIGVNVDACAVATYIYFNLIIVKT